MSFLFNCFKGILIGSGAIIPGISSGVLCIIFGIYEKLIDSIIHFFNDIKNNFKFLFPIAIGIFIGVFIFSNFLNYFFNNFPIQTYSIFIGLILGSTPSLLKEAIKNSDFKLSYLLYSLFSFLLGIFLVILEDVIPNISINFSSSFFYLLFAGFIMSIGVIVPGISSTVILMLMGVYNNYITSISSLYFPTLIPMGIGLISGCFLFMKLTSFLLDKFYEKCFFSIIGFSLGSIFVLIPDISFGLSGIISFFCVILGLLLFSLFEQNI